MHGVTGSDRAKIDTIFDGISLGRVLDVVQWAAMKGSAHNSSASLKPLAEQLVWKVRREPCIGVSYISFTDVLYAASRCMR